MKDKTWVFVVSTHNAFGGGLKTAVGEKLRSVFFAPEG